jgi:hypothetical protein
MSFSTHLSNFCNPLFLHVRVSSNNNISRIALILNRLRARYGRHLLTLHSGIGESSQSPPPPPPSSADADTSAAFVPEDGATRQPSRTKPNAKSSPQPSGDGSGAATQTADAALGPQDFYSFPTLTALALATEDELRVSKSFRGKLIEMEWSKESQQVSVGRRG